MPSAILSGSRRSGLLILGASGQVGQMWRKLWMKGLLDFGVSPIWQMRSPDTNGGQICVWDNLHGPLPDITPTAVICLSGITRGPDIHFNTDLAHAAVAVARGAPVLFASSQAVYGVQQGALRETTPCQPQTDYGRAKLAAEQAITHNPNVTSLRIGNVIGADALLRAVRHGPVKLDQFSDGQGPRRMMIGPLTLARACVDLLALGPIKAPILNLAQPRLVAMADLLTAAGATWNWQPAPVTAIPALDMDLTKLQHLIAMPDADPIAIMAEVRATGWQA